MAVDENPCKPFANCTNHVFISNDIGGRKPFLVRDTSFAACKPGGPAVTRFDRVVMRNGDHPTLELLVSDLLFGILFPSSNLHINLLKNETVNRRSCLFPR